MTVNIPGVDYSFSPPDPACLKANGYQFAMVYIGAGTEDKQLQLDERDRLFGAGLDICLLCEQAEGSAFAGYNEGVRQANVCLPDLTALQVPSSVPIFFAADRDAATPDFAAIGEFCRGAASVLGSQRVGMYGEYDLMVYLSQNYPASCRWFFQTYAWSHGLWFAGNHVEQWSNNHNICGGNVDYSRARQTNFGQWSANQSGGTSMLCNFGDGNPPQPPSEIVKALQYQLLKLDPNCLPRFGPDGGFGDETAAALSRLVTGGSGHAYNGKAFADLDELVARHVGGGGPATLVPHTHPVSVSVSVTGSGSGSTTTGAANPT